MLYFTRIKRSVSAVKGTHALEANSIQVEVRTAVVCARVIF